jgi:Sap, sulfolipid-1-addressing protein
MVNVLGQLLPLMVAVALSSVPILVVVTILLAPEAHRSALLFLIGWLVGMFAVTGLLALGVQAVPRAAAPRNQDTVGAIEIVLGLALMGYAVVLLLRGRRSPARTELPRPLRSVGAIKPVAALGLALLLNVRPKALLLATSAGLILGTSRLTTSETVIALVVFVAVGGSTVSVPVVLTLARPDRMRRPLQGTHAWLVRNSRTVTVLVLFVVGSFVLGQGMTLL